MSRSRLLATALGAGLLLALPADAQDVVNDYPTTARADYVFGCMAANGQTQDTLVRCSCSIDVIASILPYEDYVEADTVLRLRQISGEKSALFKQGEAAKAMVERLRRAQAESEIRCF